MSAREPTPGPGTPTPADGIRKQEGTSDSRPAAAEQDAHLELPAALARVLIFALTVGIATGAAAALIGCHAACWP